MASLHNLRFRLAIAVFCDVLGCGRATEQSLCMSLECMLYVCKERYFYVLFWVGVSSENLFILAGHIQKVLQWGFVYSTRSKQTENNKLRALISYTRWDDIQARPSGGRVYVCVLHTEKFAQTYTIESLEAYTWTHGNIYVAGTHMGGNAGPYQHLSRHTVNIPQSTWYTYIYIYVGTHIVGIALVANCHGRQQPCSRRSCEEVQHALIRS